MNPTFLLQNHFKSIYDFSTKYSHDDSTNNHRNQRIGQISQKYNDLFGDTSQDLREISTVIKVMFKSVRVLVDELKN